MSYHNDRAQQASDREERGERHEAGYNSETRIHSDRSMPAPAYGERRSDNDRQTSERSNESREQSKNDRDAKASPKSNDDSKSDKKSESDKKESASDKSSDQKKQE